MVEMTEGESVMWRRDEKREAVEAGRDGQGSG